MILIYERFTYFSSYTLNLLYESIYMIISLIHLCKKSVSLKMCLAYFSLLNIPTTTAQDLIQNTTHVNCNLLHGAKLHSDTLLCIFENLKNLFFAPCKNHATILFQKLNETELKIRRDFIDLNRKRRREG